MKRRSFFGSAIAAAILLASPAAKASEALRLEQRHKCIIVTGDTEQVVAFMYRFQDALWPEWRSHERTAASYKTHEQFARDNGFIAINVGCDITRTAFYEALG